MRPQVAAALLLSLAFAACWGDRDGGSADADARVDAGASAGHPTDFVFDNRGEDPVLLGNSCGGTWPRLSEDGKPLTIDDPCACLCEQRDRDGCGGCPAICLDTTELSIPGVPVTRHWDGLAMRDTNGECYTLQAPAPGTLLGAQICYDEFASDDPQCEQRGFEYGSSDEVLISAAPGPQRQEPQQVVIENQTGGPIDILVDRCGSQAWFQLAEQDARIGTTAFCPCSCNADFEPELCPACGACAADEIRTLAVGESHSFEWDGRITYQYDSGCTGFYTLPSTYGPLARVCFTRAGEAEPTCTAPRRLLRSNAFADVFVVTP